MCSSDLGKAGMKTRADTDEGEAESRYGRSRSVALVHHGRALLLLRIFLFIFLFAVFLVFCEKVVRKWRGARLIAEGGVDDAGVASDARGLMDADGLLYIGAAEMAQGRGW